MNEFDRYKAGPSQDTLRALLKAQGDAVYNVCFQVLREGAQAEDAAQQVLLGLVKQLPRISDAAHLKAWVSRAAFHAALDLKKQARRRAAHERRTAEMQTTPALTPDQVEAVHAEIARLDDDLQRVIVEHYFEKRPLRDLAAEQAISEVAVWKRLQKAKERLRASLASTGFAGALIGLDSLLEALEPVRAPEGLVGPGLMTQAAAGVSGGLVLAGGFVMKMKLIAGAGLIALLLLAGLGVGIARQREHAAAEAASSRREVNYHYTTPSAKPVPPVAPAAAPAPAAEEEVQTFTSFIAYVQAMKRASLMVDLKERTRAFRRMGLKATEAEMAAASQGCRFRPGTDEFSKHLLIALEKRRNTAEPAKALALLRGFADLEETERKKIICRLFEDWATGDAEGARTAAAGLTESEGRADVLARIAEPDTSSEGLARLAAIPDVQTRSRAVDAAVTALVRSDLAGALEVVEGLPGSIRADARRALAREWAGRDFKAVLSWIERTSDPRTRETLLLAALSRAAENHPHAAAEAVLKLADFKDGLGMMPVSVVVGALAPKDPAAAAKFLDGVPGFNGRNIVASQLAPFWGAVDAVEALVWAQQQPPEGRAEIVNAVLTGWVKSPMGSLAEARDMTRHLPEAMRPKALETVVLAWGEIEPPAAAAFALTETPDVLNRVVSRWLLRDDAAAFAWARGLTSDAARDRAVSGVVEGYLRSDPTKALAAAEAIRGGATRDRMLGQIAISLTKISGIDAGVEIVRKIGDADTRDRALGMMIQRVARETPQKAAALVESVSDPARRTEAIGSILTWGAEVDPGTCRNLLASLPEPTSVQYQKVAGGMAKKDPIAAASWALTLPEKQTERLPGESARQYEARPRSEALGVVMRAWAASDPDAAVRWIRETPMEEAARSGLLRTVQSQRKAGK